MYCTFYCVSGCVCTGINFLKKDHYENIQGEGIELDEYKAKDRTMENGHYLKDRWRKKVYQ